MEQKPHIKNSLDGRINTKKRVGMHYERCHFREDKEVPLKIN